MRNTDLTPEQFWGLEDHEKRWVEVQPYLESRGYQLRPRYRQGWQPSWPEGAPFQTIVGAEDVLRMHPGGDVLDATRISDDKAVLIKRAPLDSSERTIGLFFSSEALRADPANHCVPFLDTFPDPRDGDHIFIVMPLLRRWHDPPFRTIGEFLELLDQVIEGLVFMHDHHVAHRDAASSNIMMEATAMYPDGFHPYIQTFAKDFPKHARAKALTRSKAPPRYYFIDFGISSQFPDQESRTLVVGTNGRCRAPELSSRVPYDPFSVDIFSIGRFIRDEVEGLRGLDFLLPLAQSMLQQSPQKRPTAREVFEEFRRLRRALPQHLESRRLFSREQGFLQRIGTVLYETIGAPGLTVIGLATAALAFRFRSSLFRR